MVHTVKRIELAEILRLKMAHPDFANSGWAVVSIDGEEETVIDWYADRHAAEEAAATLDAEDG